MTGICHFDHKSLFILLNKFNLLTLFYDSLNFQASIIVVRSFFSTSISVLFKCLIWSVFHHRVLNFHFLNISTYSTIFKLSSWNFFCIFQKLCLTKHSIQLYYILPTFQIKNKAHTVETRKFCKLSFDKNIYFFLDVSKILWKNPRSCT